jgi:hypothetical protein
MPEGPEVHTVAEHITLWIPDGGGSIHIKTREPHGDPVELNDVEAAKLVELLQGLIAKLR